MELVNQFLRHVEGNLSRPTAAAYRNIVGQFFAYCADKGWDMRFPRVTRQEVEEWVGEICKKPYKRSTIRQKISGIKSFFDWLERFDHLDYNPAILLKMPKLPHRLPRYLEQSDIDRLISMPRKLVGKLHHTIFTAARDTAILELIYGAGLRVAEAIMVPRYNVDLDSGTVRVIGKGDRERIVPMGHSAVEAIATWLKIRADNDAQELFVMERGGVPMTVRTWSNRLKVYLRAAKLPLKVSSHWLRHSCATHLCWAGMPIIYIKEQLGHASVGTTQWYIHTKNEQLIDSHRQYFPRRKNA